MDEPSATPEQQRMLSNYSRRKKHSFIVSSVIAVFIYFINLLVTGLLLGIFIFVFVETKSYSEDTGCFLYSTDNVPINDLGAICDGSIAVISLLALLEVILVYLGIASIVTGERTSCKCAEIIVVLFGTVLVTAFATFISIGVYYEKEEGLCNDNDSICKESEYFFYVITWIIVILFFIAFMVQFVDCICHLPSSRTNRNLSHNSDNEVRDERRYLLKNSSKQN